MYFLERHRKARAGLPLRRVTDAIHLSFAAVERHIQ